MIKRYQKRLLLALLGSWLAHLLFSMTLFLGSPNRPLSKNVIEMDVIQRTDEVAISKKMQVVDQDAKPVNNEVPEDAKYLSQHNQNIKKQTMAQNHGEFKNAAHKKRGSQNSLHSKSLSDFLPKQISAQEILEQAQKEEATRQAQAQAAPTPKGGDVSQTLDYLKELDPGVETMLKTREFLYYTFYSRVRKQLNQYWQPKVTETFRRIYSQGRTIASSEDKITKCLVVLDKTGKLLRVFIVGNSGLHELDQAAVDSFRAAAPFPNPPKGMLGEDETVQLLWEFILSVS